MRLKISGGKESGGMKKTRSKHKNSPFNKKQRNPIIFICADRQTDRQTDTHTHTDRQIKLDCVAKTSLSAEPKGCRLAANIIDRHTCISVG